MSRLSSRSSRSIETIFLSMIACALTSSLSLRGKEDEEESVYEGRSSIAAERREDMWFGWREES